MTGGFGSPVTPTMTFGMGPGSADTAVGVSMLAGGIDALSLAAAAPPRSPITPPAVRAIQAAFGQPSTFGLPQSPTGSGGSGSPAAFGGAQSSAGQAFTAYSGSSDPMRQIAQRRLSGDAAWGMRQQ